MLATIFSHENSDEMQSKSDKSKIVKDYNNLRIHCSSMALLAFDCHFYVSLFVVAVQHYFPRPPLNIHC